MKANDLKKIIFIIILSFAFTGCDKEDKHPCYDSSIVHNDAFTGVYPGFEGCDGKNYCN